MDGWIQFSVDSVRNALPSDMATLYGTWVDANPAKANRLSELVAEMLQTFRAAVATNPANTVDVNPDTIPVTGFRHALNSVIFNLGMEMGVQFAPEVYALTTRADIWLRMVQDGGIPVGTAGNTGTPSYRIPEAERWILRLNGRCRSLLGWVFRRRVLLDG